MSDESGWVIERYFNGELRYWTGTSMGSESFLPNPREAVRFTSEGYAAKVLSWCLGGNGRAAESVWVGPSYICGATSCPGHESKYQFCRKGGEL